ncbi:DUF2218 domain-containing protein [Rhizobium sp. S152]|uniref:DUF2218 domain-containing protein n=1 Tax=Rhizobium sp. S152 TaxID=3055038 RepID=UPI0025A9576C|nr:DUF2218 domain-containing protein [Rhizobium sp. S152]MDM9624945.1 DUF2218 domain-containing protein [Rhizobium sp. S152]
MSDVKEFRLAGTALPKDPIGMLDEICEHFVEHAEVRRTGNLALLKSKAGDASIQVEGSRLLIELNCPTPQMLQMSRTMLAEHLFYFAGEDPFELSWAEQLSLASLPNIHEAVVVSTEEVTPHMRRVKFACADVTPFIGGDMHVRLLVPPKGREPVWPGVRQDGRVAWPEGEDELLVRVYTIRFVDVDKGELWVDFLQHPAAGIKTPGADFAMDAQPGDRVALVGPGGGSLPNAKDMLFIGDESALPAIARIVAEMPVGATMQAIIEVLDAGEEQLLPSAGNLSVRWLHRKDYPEGAKNVLADEATKAIMALDKGSFVWAACEKDDIRTIRALLKSRGHDRKNMYVAWYWERDAS